MLQYPKHFDELISRKSIRATIIMKLRAIYGIHSAKDKKIEKKIKDEAAAFISEVGLYF